MADIETKGDKLDERVSSLERQVSETTANVNSLIRELKDFKDEMRQQNEMRSEEIREIRTGLSDMGKHVRNLSITAMAAIGAMVVTVVISLLRN